MCGELAQQFLRQHACKHAHLVNVTGHHAYGSVLIYIGSAQCNMVTRYSAYIFGSKGIYHIIIYIDVGHIARTRYGHAKMVPLAVIYKTVGIPLPAGRTYVETSVLHTYVEFGATGEYCGIQVLQAEPEHKRKVMITGAHELVGFKPHSVLAVNLYRDAGRPLPYNILQPQVRSTR